MNPMLRFAGNSIGGVFAALFDCELNVLLVMAYLREQLRHSTHIEDSHAVAAHH
jgi:hypothetical protein